MTDEEIRAYIDLAVKRSVIEYKKSGLLEQSKSVVFSEVSEMLSAYYGEGKKDATITYALQGIRFDPYFRIIPMYYEEGRTNEGIAEALGVDVSTIMRNKRRLCLLIYNEIV